MSLFVSVKLLRVRLIRQFTIFVISFVSLLSSNVYANQADDKRLKIQAEQFQTGLDEAQKGKLKNALTIWEELNQSGDLIPELKRALEYNIAVVFIKQKRYEEAKKRLDSALQSDAQVATTLENLNQISAYDAQKAYQRIFKDTPVNLPKAEWLYFDVKRAKLPTDNVIIDEKNADSVRVIKKTLEQWRQAWSVGDILRVNPQYTSQTCPSCQHVSLDNRKSQSAFEFTECGFKANADLVGALNILERGHRLLACGVETLVSSKKQEPVGSSNTKLLLTA